MGDKTSFKLKWLQDQVSKIRKVYSIDEISNEELKEYLLKVYETRRTVTGRFYNNTTKENKQMTIENYLNFYLNNDYIINGYNTLVKNQNTRTIAIEALKDILDQRSVNKKKQQSAPKGSLEYIYYKVMQLTFKILANFVKEIRYKEIYTIIDSLICWNPLEPNPLTETARFSQK